MSTSGWSFMDEGMFLDEAQRQASKQVEPAHIEELQQGCREESPHFQTSSEWRLSTADPGDAIGPTQSLNPPKPQPAMIQDLEEDLWEASSGSSSASSCHLAPVKQPSGSLWISLSHPNAQLMLHLLGGRAEDQWE